MQVLLNVGGRFGVNPQEPENYNVLCNVQSFLWPHKDIVQTIDEPTIG